MAKEPLISVRGDSAPPAPSAGEGRRAQSRWTEKLMRRGFTPVAVEFLQRYARLAPKLSHAETLLIIHLMSFKWDEKAPYPSVGLLAERLGVSTRYVRKMLKRLGALGYVERKARHRNTNLFVLNGLFARLEEMPDLGNRKRS